MTAEDKLKAATDKVSGKAKEGVGNLTNNEDLVAEGKADQVKGSAHEAKGHVKDAANDVKDAFDK